MYDFYIWLQGEKFMDQQMYLPQFEKDSGLREGTKTGVKNGAFSLWEVSEKGEATRNNSDGHDFSILG